MNELALLGLDLPELFHAVRVEHGSEGDEP
jgi:hypothetical protein